MKTYKNHYLPAMLGEFERARKEFDASRTLDDPPGKQMLVVKVLEKAENQMALLYMCDEMAERITQLEDQVIKLMVTLNKYDQGNNHDGTLQGAGDDRGTDQG